MMKKTKYSKCSCCEKTIRLIPNIDYDTKTWENFYCEYYCKNCGRGTAQREEYEQERVMNDVFADEY